MTTTQISHHGNPTNEEKLQSRINSLETALEERNRDYWSLVAKSEQTTASLAVKCLRLIRQEITVINCLTLATLIVAYTIVLDLLVATIEYAIHVIVMYNRSPIQVAIDKLNPHGFNFLTTLADNAYPLLVFILTTIGFGLTITAFNLILKTKIKDLA